MRYKYTVVREVSQEKISVRYKYTVVREVSQKEDKRVKEGKEGPDRNITPPLSSEVP